MEEEIMRRIAAAVESGGRIEGVLFHGTCEEIEGELRPGGDGLLWTSDSPVIAQQYMPKAGIEAWCAVPNSWEMDDRVKPEPSSAYYAIAKAMTGLDALEMEFDRNRTLVSWRLPDGWPRLSDVIRHVEGELGYVPDRGCYRLLESRGQIMKADWRLPGVLFATLSDGLSFMDARQSSESDLTLYEHNRTDLFALADNQGFDGVIINDFAQTGSHGNLGHRSWGLNHRGLASRTWISIPAIRFDLPEEGPFPDITPEVAALVRSMPSPGMR